MSEQAGLPHSQGDLTESQAIERMRAKAQAGQIPEPKTPEEVLEERDPPEGGLNETDDSQVDPENAQVEGGEFADEGEEGQPAAVASDPVVRFDDGTEAPLSEVKRGFLRQQDYTRKTQEVAQTRKQIESERQQYVSEKQQIADRLGPLIQQARAIVEATGDQQALAELRATDPGAYAVRMMEINARRQQLAMLEAEQTNLRQSSEREQQERAYNERKQQAEQSRSALMEKIPAAKKDFRSWYSSLGEYVIQQGVPAEIWDNEVDHSVITLAWKAMQYDNAARKAPATKEQLRNAPQPLRPGAAKPPGYAQARAVREATERVNKTGSIEDAIKLQMLKQQTRR